MPNIITLRLLFQMIMHEVQVVIRCYSPVQTAMFRSQCRFLRATYMQILNICQRGQGQLEVNWSTLSRATFLLHATCPSQFWAFLAVSERIARFIWKFVRRCLESSSAANVYNYNGYVNTGRSQRYRSARRIGLEVGRQWNRGIFHFSAKFIRWCGSV